jgi:hypothetical protein
MRNLSRLVIQALAYLGFAVVVGYLSASPAYDYAATEMTTIKLSLSHAAQRVKPCVQLTPEQIAELAPNMRLAEQCERERLPLVVQLEIDDRLVVQTEAPPSGLWNDGPASVYERIEFVPGDHVITARLRDSNREEGWDYTHTERVSLEPGRYFTITFRAGAGGFTFK